MCNRRNIDKIDQIHLIRMELIQKKMIWGKLIRRKLGN